MSLKKRTVTKEMNCIVIIAKVLQKRGMSEAKAYVSAGKICKALTKGNYYILAKVQLKYDYKDVDEEE